MAQNKIKTLSELVALSSAWRNENKKIVLCHGIFDLLHIGHIRHFEQARQLGDLLLVTITPDRFVEEGAERPAFSEQIRAEAVASLNTVDFVAVNSWPTAEETLRCMRPDIYVKGAEIKKAASHQLVSFEREKQALFAYGGEIAFTDDTDFASTRVINDFLANCSSQVQQYLQVFKTRYNIDDIMYCINRLQNLKVLVIGDAIIDDYHYCQTLGVSSKDPALAFQYKSHDLFAGGVLAVANHLANFAEKVRLFSVLGEKDSFAGFIHGKLEKNVIPNFYIQDNAPTIVKRRYIEGYSLNKMFEVYVMEDSGLSSEKEKQLLQQLESELSDYDLVVAADFGHGAISEKTRALLLKKAPFLAINTQANAGNRGFNTVSKYPGAAYICIAEHELRLDARCRNGEIRPLLLDVAKRLGCRKMAVTRGKRGCAVYDKRDGYIEVPALGGNIVDRVGAGDALLSITSLLACRQVPVEVLGFVGNVVGGLAVQIMGNKKSIDRQSVQQTITDLFRTI